MSEYQVFRKEALIAAESPATHAIVIGVGSYPHLVNGSGALADLNGGMRQLSSPPTSAYEIATWLLDKFNNPDKPLASISMLISDDALKQYTHARLDQTFTPQMANLFHIKKAVREWKTLGDLNEDNLMLFFFCGHGVAGGIEQVTLLLSDYGEDNSMPMDGALDFSAMKRGMSQCAASQQCFFIDACRTRANIATATTATGQQIIQDNLKRDFDSDLSLAVIYATLDGEKAYGRVNKPSFYTEELIIGLNGAGSNKRNGKGVWRVSTNDLHSAVHRGLTLRGDKLKSPIAESSIFEFHELQQDPVVPIAVYCTDESDTDLATFRCLKAGNEIKRRLPEENEWYTDIPFGNYDFEAEVDARKGQRKDEIVMPPYQEIQIDVETES